MACLIVCVLVLRQTRSNKVLEAPRSRFTLTQSDILEREGFSLQKKPQPSCQKSKRSTIQTPYLEIPPLYVAALGISVDRVLTIGVSLFLCTFGVKNCAHPPPPPHRQVLRASYTSRNLAERN